MTTFLRRGHFRRGRNGRLIWVEGHMVTRSSGRSNVPASSRSTRSAYPGLTPPVSPKRTSSVSPRAASQGFSTPTHRLPQSIRWARPNATCPVCGAFVYFYANELGSRVYFDEIGPPWPKHPCTDNATYHGAAGIRGGGRTTPPLYSAAVGRLKLVEASVPATTTRKAFIVQEARQNERGTLLHLQRLYQKSAVEAWGTPDYVSLEVGQLVFVEGDSLSYLDPQRVEAVRIPVYFQHRIPKESFLKRLRAKLDL